MSFKKTGERRVGVGVGNSDGGKQTVFDRILSTQPANLIQYLPGGERDLGSAYDRSGQNNNGLYVGSPTLGVPGIGDGRTAVRVDGNNQLVNLYTAGLDSDFSGAECTVSIWTKVPAAQWTDGTNRQLVFLAENSGTNYIRIIKQAPSNKLAFTYVAASTVKQYSHTFSSTVWFHAGITISAAADEVKAYIDGIQVGSTMTGLGTYSGSLVSTLANIGAQDSSGLLDFIGDWQHYALWAGVGGALTPAQMRYIYDGEV